jgi:hypothetical protein
LAVDLDIYVEPELSLERPVVAVAAGTSRPKSSSWFRQKATP